MRPADGGSRLHIAAQTEDHRVVLTFAGVLDAATYRTARDAVVKAALDGPEFVVVDVSALQVPAPSAWSVFTSARWLTNRWPEVALGLACTHATGRRAIRRNGVERYLPVYGSAVAAVTALAETPRAPRRRARQRWPAHSDGVGAAQRFVARCLTEWSRPEMIATASVVATVLIDNVLRHTRSEPDLRLETDGTTVTVAVTDGSALLARIPEGVERGGPRSELHLVELLARLWGNTPIEGGKVVWAILGPENRL